ncbi:uncharacterized protein N7498_008469 [Penicillium cinerascens]|uniref:BHLH domain-containing protein n=1 Tax=Penicillium cinerascens TaxID=70096 RepID=A0A9W9JIR8_9EURO|nr:uncharacterized protein N7498_008469 [Penicillium cinerascens]KAJ5195031.1 hypothetical protein N7498_008469 [Penicillium cinerascens]
MDPMMGPSGPQKPKKKRIRNWTAEDRAVHREFEKSRREAFSERLAELTTLLPMLKTEQRPSKHIIVDASIAQHKAQEARIAQATRALQSLMAEREALLREVNSIRAMCQPGACVPLQAQPIDPAVLDMLPGRNELAAGPLRRSDRPLELPLPLSIHETSLMPVSSSAPVPGHMSHRPLSHDNPPVSPHNLTHWAWAAQDKSSQPIDLSPTIAHGGSLLWTQSPGVLTTTTTTTPPKDVDSGYDTNPNHLVDDAAIFWSQHPGSLTNTPPQDGDSPFNINSTRVPGDPSMLWSPNVPVATTKLPNDAIIIPQQVFQSAHSFPNHESLRL